MMKFICTSLLLCLLAFGARAATAEALVISSNSGAETVVFLSEHPSFTYAPGSLRIQTSTTVSEIEFGQLSVMKFEQRDTSSALTSVEKPSLILDLSHADEVHIQGLSPDSELRVATLSGRSAGSFRADADGRAVIPLASIPSGSLVIISTPVSTIKLIKK